MNGRGSPFIDASGTISWGSEARRAERLRPSTAPLAGIEPADGHWPLGGFGVSRG